MFHTLLLILILLAALSLLWWGVSQLTLPPPVKTVVLVALGLVALWMIYTWVIGGTISLR